MVLKYDVEMTYYLVGILLKSVLIETNINRENKTNSNQIALNIPDHIHLNKHHWSLSIRPIHL
jgi:hypothetical protein